jgi:hypothetical protein
MRAMITRPQPNLLTLAQLYAGFLFVRYQASSFSKAFAMCEPDWCKVGYFGAMVGEYRRQIRIQRLPVKMVRLNNPWVEMTGRLSPVRFCGVQMDI